ncbi:hypothetical protein MMC26_003990 [Xylographa opegraphella]|nr:hypothetical protein [Xylographa opegraphella]
MATIDQFLSEINQILRSKNGPKLCDYLVLEPPLPPLYNVIVNELRQNFPISKQDALEAQCRKRLPEYDEGDVGGSWRSFISFLVQYFVFLRDVNVEQLLETHDILKALLQSCTLALSDATMGIVVLPTIISFSRTLARLAIGLDKRPDLIAHLTHMGAGMGGEDIAERVTLVESSANVIREALKKCLSEKAGNATGLDVNGRPDGRRIGIYLLGNICLKLFFHCRKLRSAEFVFNSINQNSPPLFHFAAAQRVTYLYYLGRYHFANNHFFRAQSALQAAYDQCHREAVKQRRSILVYLITSNIILGRFPSLQVLTRPEAERLQEIFLPICQAIKKGDLATFRSLLDMDHPNAAWLLKKRVLLQLRNRCEVLVWRSLARRTFVLSGFTGDATRKAPSLSLEALLTLALYLEGRVSVGGAEVHNGHPKNVHNDYVDPDLDGEADPEDNEVVSVGEIESIVASLIHQDLLHGYLSHRYFRFVITGAKAKAAVEVGFPNVWSVFQAAADAEVPGWVKEDRAPADGPRVIKITGARPAGAV